MLKSACQNSSCRGSCSSVCPSFVLGLGPLVVRAWLGTVYTRVGCFHRDMVCCDRFGPRCSGLARRQAGLPTVRKQLLVFAGPGASSPPTRSVLRCSAPAGRAPSQRHRHSQTEYDPSGRRRDVGPADRRRRVWACRGGMAGFALGGESRRPRVTAPSRADRICKCGRHHGHLLCHGGRRVGHRRCGNGPTAGFVLLRDLL